VSSFLIIIFTPRADNRGDGNGYPPPPRSFHRRQPWLPSPAIGQTPLELAGASASNSFAGVDTSNVSTDAAMEQGKEVKTRPDPKVEIQVRAPPKLCNQ